MAIFNKISAAVVLQEYTKAAKNAKREILVTVYQGSENY